MKNVVLVGFMGTGKTAIGKRLAHQLKMKYISTDDIIEEKERRPIAEIFAKEGEPYFRKAEKEVVREVSGMDNVIIAAGGGVVLDNENLKNLKVKGILICLNAAAEDILERTKRYTHRPLLNVPDPLGKIRELLAERGPYYRRADYQVDTSGKGADRVADEIRRIIDKL